MRRMAAERESAPARQGGFVMADRQALSPTLESYPEAMARLVDEKGLAPARDIADVLSVHKSTVTAALKNLSEKGLVNYSPYEISTLTPRGRQIAQRIADRHDVIVGFLVEVLSVDEAMAQAAACRMEHDLDNEVLDRLRLFAEFVKRCPHCGKERLQAFEEYYERQSRTSEEQAQAP